MEHLYNIGIWRKLFRPFMAPLPLSERDIHRATEVTVSPSPSRSRIHQPVLLTEKGLA